VSLLRTPPLSVVAAVVDAIQAQGAVAAVGGSGLLAALGLVGRVRDWDVTTDAETETVEAALRATGLPVAPAPAGEGSYATRARFVVPCADHDVDVLVGFALRDNRGGVVPMPARVTRTWSGLPIADPRRVAARPPTAPAPRPGGPAAALARGSGATCNWTVSRSGYGTSKGGREQRRRFRRRFLFRATSRWREGCRRQVERQEPLSNRCRQLRRTDRAPVVVEPALGILLAADELVAERTDDAC